MSIARRLLGAETRSVGRGSFDRDIQAMLGAPNTASGQVVDRDNAMRVSAVFGSVRILSDTISTLPANAYLREAGVRKGYRRPTWLENPSATLGRIELLGQTMVSLLLAGNAYWATARDALGQVVSITVLDPDLVTPRDEVIRTDGPAPVTRRVYDAVGRTWTQYDIQHIPGMMLPGAIRGLSPIRYAEETIGLSLAAQEYGAKFFGNGALPGALVEVPTSLSDQGVRQLKAAWNDAHRGAGNSHRLAVLTEGAKFSKVTLSPDEAQFLQTRAFQVPDIARIFGVPPHLLADASGSTSWGSGLAEQNIAFAQHSLRPWVERVEAALTRVLVSQGDDPRAFIKLNMDGVLRGSLEQRMGAYSVGLQQGIYTLDEVRAMEDLAPVPGGKGATHRVPLNLGPVGEMPPAAKRALADALGLPATPEEGTK